MAEVQRVGRTVRALVLACHPGPTLAVTVLTALLAWSAGHTLARGLLVTTAVLTGQLTIGWSNDLIDARRDRAVGRTDKPLAAGDVRRRSSGPPAALRSSPASCCRSRAAGRRASSTCSSGSRPAGPTTSGSSAPPVPAAVCRRVRRAAGRRHPRPPSPAWPPAWVLVTGGLLGVGAHLLNALPDLADDEATGVRGLPQRLGERVVRWLAPAVLLAGSVVAAFGPGLDATGLALLVRVRRPRGRRRRGARAACRSWRRCSSRSRT